MVKTFPAILFFAVAVALMTGCYTSSTRHVPFSDVVHLPPLPNGLTASENLFLNSAPSRLRGDSLAAAPAPEIILPLHFTNVTGMACYFIEGSSDQRTWSNVEADWSAPIPTVRGMNEPMKFFRGRAMQIPNPNL